MTVKKHALVSVFSSHRCSHINLVMPLQMLMRAHRHELHMESDRLKSESPNSEDAGMQFGHTDPKLRGSSVNLAQA